MNKARLALVLLIALSIVTVAIGAKVETAKLTKQTSSSTGDSLTDAADTSGVFTVPRSTSAFYIWVSGDSAMTYTVQVSPDGTYWATVDKDSSVAAQAEQTADLGLAYAGQRCRVILENTAAGASDYGSAWRSIVE